MASFDHDSDRTPDNTATPFGLTDPDASGEVTQSWLISDSESDYTEPAYVEHTESDCAPKGNPWLTLAVFALAVVGIVVIALLIVS